MRVVLFRRGLLPVLTGMLMLSGEPARAVDWDDVTGTEITLFYPGQASWQWVLTASDHSAADRVRAGIACQECHAGEEADIGDLIASGQILEPRPIAGKRGSITAIVKTAHDGERLYVRLQWPEAPSPSEQPESVYEARVSMIFDDRTVAEARGAACWAACHDDMTNMASASPGGGLTKYLSRSRTRITRQGGGTGYQPQAEIDKTLRAGTFLEYWEAGLRKDAPAIAMNGYILERRHTSDSPLVSADAGFADGVWTVILSRVLRPGQLGYKDIEVGKSYIVGFAIHEAYATDRFHHVSFEHSLAVDDGHADLIARGR